MYTNMRMLTRIGGFHHNIRQFSQQFCRKVFPLSKFSSNTISDSLQQMHYSTSDTPENKIVFNLRCKATQINDGLNSGSPHNYSSSTAEEAATDPPIAAGDPPIAAYNVTEAPPSWSDVTNVKYEKFGASGSRTIYDITEEELGLADDQQDKRRGPYQEPLMPCLDITRGVTGVFDLPQLVSLLQQENALQLVAIKMPERMQYVDYMVIVTATSYRHLEGVATAVKQNYHMMKRKKDRWIILEGTDSTWVAIDLGNIALHIMSPGERKRVDIESLWVCGPEHDLKLSEDSEIEAVDSSYIFSLADPAILADASSLGGFDFKFDGEKEQHEFEDTDQRVDASEAKKMTDFDRKLAEIEFVPADSKNIVSSVKHVKEVVLTDEAS